jgi:peptide/nickel transport system substrate-binding protein
MYLRTGLRAAGLGLAVAIAAGPAGAGAPKHGGTLTYVIPADAPPSFDGHRETTYATIHAAAPYYSVLIRVPPDNPASTTEFVCDLCTEMPKPTDDGKTYTFKIRQGVKWHDGSKLTAQDVATSWNMIVFPPKGVTSARVSYYEMIDKIEAPDAATVVFHLKRPTTAFLPALADPYAWIYKKEILEKDPRWYEKNIMGSGPFKFASYDVGQSIKGVRNPDYYREGQPYLDAIVGIFADKQSVRVDALRGDRAAIEFRGLPPSARDQLVKEGGSDIAVQDSDWNCGNILTPNHRKKPFDDVRVRRALALAIDQWKGAPALAKIATVRTVGGIVFPGSPLAATQEELQQMVGYWPDIEKSRAEAASPGRAGAEGGRFAEPQRRSALQVRRHLGDRRVEEIGLSVERKVVPTGVVPEHARGYVRRGARSQLRERRQSGARHRQVPAGQGLSGKLRRLRRCQVDRAVREDADRNRSQEAARGHARLREAHARRDDARDRAALLVPHRAGEILRQGLEDQSQPLPEPGSRQRLADK